MGETERRGDRSLCPALKISPAFPLETAHHIAATGTWREGSPFLVGDGPARDRGGAIRVRRPVRAILPWSRNKGFDGLELGDGAATRLRLAGTIRRRPDRLSSFGVKARSACWTGYELAASPRELATDLR